MNPLGIFGLLGFGILAVLYALVAVRGRAGTLKKGAAIGLHNRELEASEEAWLTGHEAAWPILAMASAVAAFHAVGCAIAGLLMGADGAAFTRILCVSGVVVAIALWFVASAAAVAAVNRMK